MKKMHTYSNNYSSFFDGELDVMEINRKKRKKFSTTEEFILKAISVHGDKYDYSKVNYKKRSENVLIICKEHEIEFHQTPTNHLSGWFGCPHCSFKGTNISIGEMKIKRFLDENGIRYVHQKRFDDCKHIKTLRFDFWLPEHRMIIEYDGEQHFFPIDFWGGDFSFEKQQIRDNKKLEYAKENNYKLLRIPYTEKDNISEILEINLD